MTRATYVIRNGELVEKHLAEPLEHAGPAFNFISDTMDATQHMANGKWYTSKSEFRKATKAAGCIEVGNEKLKPFKPIPLDRRKRAMDIKRAIEELRSR
jgi:hypothetical protein